MKIYRIAFATLAVLIASAFFATRADVVVCSDAACSIESSKTKAAMSGSDLVYTCGSNTPVQATPKTACNSPQTYLWSGMQSYSWVLTDSGWYRYQDIPDIVAPPIIPAIPFVYQTPVCMPANPLSSEIRKQLIGTRLRIMWFCDTDPAGIRRYVRFHDLGERAKAIGIALIERLSIGLAFTKNDLQAADELSSTRWASPAEQAESDIFQLANSIKASVINNSAGAIDAPTYLANVDGTQNKTVYKRVPIGRECNWTSRLVIRTSGIVKATTLYLVVDPTDPKPSYANCKIDGVVSK